MSDSAVRNVFGAATGLVLLAGAYAGWSYYQDYNKRYDAACTAIADRSVAPTHFQNEQDRATIYKDCRSSDLSLTTLEALNGQGLRAYKLPARAFDMPKTWAGAAVRVATADIVKARALLDTTDTASPVFVYQRNMTLDGLALAFKTHTANPQSSCTLVLSAPLAGKGTISGENCGIGLSTNWGQVIEAEDWNAPDQRHAHKRSLEDRTRDGAKKGLRRIIQ